MSATGQSRNSRYRQNMRRTIFGRDGGICWICQAPIEDYNDYTIDHIVPRSRGGRNSVQNYAPAHRCCNETRGNTIINRTDPRFARAMAVHPQETRMTVWTA